MINIDEILKNNNYLSIYSRKEYYVETNIVGDFRVRKLKVDFFDDCGRPTEFEELIECLLADLDSLPTNIIFKHYYYQEDNDVGRMHCVVVLEVMR